MVALQACPDLVHVLWSFGVYNNVFICFFRQGQVKDLSIQRKQNLGDSLLYAQFKRDVVEVNILFTSLQRVCLVYKNRSNKIQGFSNFRNSD